MTDPLRRRFPWLDAADEPALRRLLLERAAAQFEQCEDWRQAAGCWADLGKPERAGVLYARAGDRRAAARTLLDAGRLDAALDAHRAWAETLSEHDRQGRIDCLLGQAACLHPSRPDQASALLAEARGLIALQAATDGPGPYAAARAWAALGDHAVRIRRADLLQQGCEQALAGYAEAGAGEERLAAARRYLAAAQALGDRALARSLETRIAEWTPEPGQRAAYRPPTYEQLLERAKGIQAMARLEGHTEPIQSVAFSPDGRLLATGSYDSRVRVWTLPRGEPLHTLEGHINDVRGVGFSPDGRWLASCSRDDTIRLWSPQTGATLRTLSVGSDVNAIAFSPNARLLASASHDRTIRLSDLRRDEPPHSLSGHQAAVVAVAFATDGRLMASGSDDNTIRLWDPVEGRALGVLEGHGYWVNSIAFNPTDRSLASGSADNTLRCWDALAGRETACFEEHTTGVNAVAWSPDGSVLVSRGNNSGDPPDGEVIFRHMPSGRVFHRLPQLAAQSDGWWTTRALAISPDGRLLATYPEDTTKAIQLWDISALVIGPPTPAEGLSLDPGDLDDSWHSLKATIERHPFQDGLTDALHLTHPEQQQALAELARLPSHPERDAFMRRLAPEGMVYIPPGAFQMGSGDDDPDADPSERPAHSVHLDGYFIDRFPVTNDAFDRFVRAGGYGEQQLWLPAGWTVRQRYDWEGPRVRGDGRTDPRRLPLVAISWFEADAYARWLGKSLPSEPQWEKAAGWDAARGRKRRYPWGERWDPRRSHIVGQRAAAPVGTHSPNGDSPYGAADMGGNVNEWTSTAWHGTGDRTYRFPYRADDGREQSVDLKSAVVKCAAWGAGEAAAPILARCAARDYAAPDLTHDRRGFRCSLNLTTAP